MKRTFVLAAAVMAAVLFSGNATPVHAQVGATFVGVGEFDTDDVYMGLVGVSVSPRGQGWTWVAGVSAYWLQYPLGGLTDNERTIKAITPSVGIKNNFGSGSALARIGYSFTDRDTNETVPAFTAEANDDGFVTSAQLDYWGSGTWMAQGIASYNLESEAFWGRARLGRNIITLGNGGAISLGAEAAYLDSNNYNATKVGGVLGFNPGAGTQLNAVVGRKIVDGGSNATYFAFELVLYPH